MDECVFCTKLRTTPEVIYQEDATGQFAMLFDQFPVRPGHALVIPKRHVQHFEELTQKELASLAPFVARMKGELRQLDLTEVYNKMHSVSEKSASLIATARELLSAVNHRPPDGFSDGINDGAAGGQTVPHLHWHVIPRWQGDMSEPRGGIRNMFGKELGQYFK